MATRTRAVGWVTHEKFYWHDSGLESYTPWVQPHGSNESAESKRRFANLVEVTPLADALVRIKPRAATDAEILRFHTAEYLAQVKHVSGLPAGGLIGHEMHLGPRGFDIAALSLGGVLASVEAVMAGTVRTAYALVRPPGHHAERDTGMGFCCFSNISLAAVHAIEACGAKRVAILDWDVHHGNGTEQHVYDDDRVLFISLHQDKLYPLHTGGVESVGEGRGRGHAGVHVSTVMLWRLYATSKAPPLLQRVVAPALRAFKPDLILVSSGFDASFLDTLGRMSLTSESYRLMTRQLAALADELCGGRIVLAHEGGYSEIYVPFCGVAVLEELSGVESGVEDPFIADVGSEQWQALQPHQDAAIAAAEANLRIALLPK